jgi:DNA-binding LacI/PurR family transcriptional regulator
VDGVHCGNDFLALGFLDRIRADGLRVPADLSVVGCDNIAEAAWTSYDLTTVTQDAEAVVSASLAALIELVEGEGEEEPAPTIDLASRLTPDAGGRTAPARRAADRGPRGGRACARLH